MSASTTRRSLSALTAALALTVGLAPAQAHQGGGGRQATAPATTLARGVVVSSDATAGTIVVTLSYEQPLSAAPAGHGGAGCTKQGPSSGQGTAPRSRRTRDAAPAPVTITTDATTSLTLNGSPATVGDFVAGTPVTVTLDSAGATSLTDALAKPALSVVGVDVKAFYGFAGTVTAVDTTAGTVTVNVARSAPAGLVPAGSAPVTFTVGATTKLVGPGAKTLGGVGVGDHVSGTLIAAPGLTLAQVSSTALAVLIDVPGHASARGHHRHARRHGHRRR